MRSETKKQASTVTVLVAAVKCNKNENLVMTYFKSVQ